MIAFLSWYILLTLLGWLTFPLAWSLFPALADRGYSLARAAGLLIWGFAFWLLASLGIAQNDSGGLLLALALLTGISAWVAVRNHPQILSFLRANLPLVLTTELLFLIAFAFLAFLRSANPELASTEKPMELAFINAILRSPSFPPQDPWLSGYAISYYYFGYVMTAMLARLSGVPGSLAHNLMTALVFALGAVGAYGILYNLLEKVFPQGRRALTFNALFGPVFLLLVSNLGALFEVLHQGGFLWTKDPATGLYTSAFWTWLDMKELSQPPELPLHWLPLERYMWWWRSSRVLQDYDLLKHPLEVIDEFPFFSFLLGDLHPHVLAIPFGLLAVAVAMNFFFGGFNGSIELSGFKLRVSPQGFLFSALVIGGLAFLNTWDILIAAALIVSAHVFWRAREDGWAWSRLEDLLVFALPLGSVSILLYLPFYLGFSSQAGGILPNLMYATRGAHLWSMWATLLLPLFCLLFYLAKRETGANWELGLTLGVGLVLFLWAFSWLLAWTASILKPDFVMGFLDAQGMSASAFFAAATSRRVAWIGSLLTLLAVLVPALALLFKDRSAQSEDAGAQNAPAFVLLLALFGALLVLAPDFVYLRDNFGYRINTVFKFYYQAWALWSLAAAFAAVYLLYSLRGISGVLFRVLLGLVLFTGLLFPVLGVMTKTNNFKPFGGFTLNDLDRIARENPDEAAAIRFLQTVPNGVVAEAVGDSYSGFARISTFTGLQTVLGWKGHEAQWRGSYELQGSRADDILKLYSTTHWDEAALILAQYDIRYVYIGGLERSTMPVSEEKFKLHLAPVFQQGSVVIYEVR